MKSKITIVVPTYNAEKTIEKCLNSLKRQTLKESYQVIIINDGSTDDSVNRIKKIISTDKRFKLISKENTGLSNTRNLGIKYTDTEYVTFVDSDDFVEENYIEKLLEGYNKENCDLSIVGYQKEREDGSIIFKSKNTKFHMDPDLAMHEILISGGFEGYTWNKLYRTSIIKKYNLQFKKSTEPLEDLYFDFIYLKYCRKIYYSNVNVYHYIVHPSSIINSTKIGTNFNKKSLNAINILKSINEIIPYQNIRAKNAVKAKICWTAVSVIRIIYASQSQEDIEKNILIRLNAVMRKYSTIFLKNDIFPKRDKIIFMINRISPKLFAWIWNNLGLHGMG